VISLVTRCLQADPRAQEDTHKPKVVIPSEVRIRPKKASGQAGFGACVQVWCAAW